MKRTTPILIAFALFALASTAAAGDKAEKNHAQQDKFAHCAHDSKGLKGEERSKFMSDCLKGHNGDHKPAKAARHESDHPTGQQGKMKTCNDEARRKDLHGDERRAFMSSCLKG